MGGEDSSTCQNGLQSAVGGTIGAADAEEVVEPPIRSIQPQGDDQVILDDDRSESTSSENTYSYTEKGRKIEVSNLPHEPTKVYDAAHAHTLSSETLVSLLTSDQQSGLTSAEAASRLARDGPNKFRELKVASPWEILLRQISNSLTLVLVITMGVSFGIKDYIEGAVIAAVILLNIVVGFFQDYRAEQQILSLQALSAPVSKVLRDGQVQHIKAENLVVGDIVHLTVGDVVPADVRLLDSINVSMDEALLTGESLPVSKTASAIMKEPELAIGDRLNMCYAATTVSVGRGTGIVVSTGMGTEVGKIAGLLDQKRRGDESTNKFVKALIRVKDKMKSVLGLIGTPLQVKLSKFALLLFALAILLAIIVFSVNVWEIDGEVLIYGICVAVAVIPESLIAVLTITVAVGTKAMAKGNVIVRRLASLEAVGGVSAICSDKTGTLTQGRMIVRKAWIPGTGTFNVHGTSNPFSPVNGNLDLDGEQLLALKSASHSPLTDKFLKAIALCNLSSVYQPSTIKTSTDTFSTTGAVDDWVGAGEPTEIALQVFAMRFGSGKPSLLEDGNRRLVSEFPFDSTIKRMTVVYKNLRAATTEAFTKGAAEVIVPLLDLSELEKQKLLSKAEEMASEGLRVLCIAYKALDIADQSKELPRNSVEVDLTLCGLVGLYDPPRVETLGAVKKCQVAGISVHMLTGDHVRTAEAVAREVGILRHTGSAPTTAGSVVKASDFDSLSDEEIDALENLPMVLARCSPSTKVRMVGALQRRGQFCVMTGDGVNDSPSLKQADVGIAMGLNGTDVAKDASDMILADDNFSSIVKAVEEGRRLFDNIQKFLMHLLISNISQVILLLAGLGFQDRAGYSVFPLSPLEILWVNLITSSFLAIGLGLEEATPDVMLRPPHNLRVGVFTRELITDKMIYGTFMGSLCLVAFVTVTYVGGGGDLGLDCNVGWNETCDTAFKARGTAWATLTMLLLVTAWEVKHFTRSLFALDPRRGSERSGIAGALKTTFEPLWRNKFLFWAVVAGFIIAFPVIYIPVVNREVFKHEGITWEWGIVFGCLVVYVSLVESWKAVKRRFGIGARATIRTGEDSV